MNAGNKIRLFAKTIQIAFFPVHFAYNPHGLHLPKVRNRHDE
jgi:hypothetical protein